METSYASKRELMQWTNRLLSLQISSLNELMSGAIWCQVLDAFFSGVVAMSKVDFYAYNYEQCMLNYKVLQQAFDKLNIARNVDIQKMLDGHQGTLLEFLQWIYKFCSGRHTTAGYNPEERRRISKHGGSNVIPAFGINEAAFKRWRMKDSRRDYMGGQYVEGAAPPVKQPVPIAVRPSTAKTRRPAATPKVGESNGASRRARPVQSPAHESGGPESPRFSLETAVDVATDASAALANNLSVLSDVAEKMGRGEVATYIARGRGRSVQDVLITLVRHTALLLKEISLRLDISNAVDDVQLRVQVDRVLKELSSTQSTLAYVSGAIRDYEANAKPLLEATQSQDEATRSEAAVISEVTLTLDHLLRKVGAAQAALPAIGRGSDPGPAGILSQLQEIDPATQAELQNHEPQFLKTSTSHAFKLGNYQVRKLRNGDVYKGRYSHSKKSGSGHYTFLNGDVYEGEFSEDHMKGSGVYTFCGQGRYEGQWHDALYSGYGTETFAKGSTYHGAYLSGNRSSFGVCRYYNGDYYEGMWSDGLRNGNGMQQCTDSSNYVGQYKNAKRDGFGVYTFPNGDSYMGMYELDLPHGVGVYVFGGGQSYMGMWFQGKKHGLCEYIVETGEKYAGEWDQGKPKWVQSLGDTAVASATDEAPELRTKIEAARQAADQARLAAEQSRQKAADHWDSHGEMQMSLNEALRQAEGAAADAQGARARAMALAQSLDELVSMHAGPQGWQTDGKASPELAA